MPDDPTVLSKRARQIIVQAAGEDGVPAAPPSRTAERVQAIKVLRDQFDDESPRVGLRDSSWLIVSGGVLFTTAFTWGHPSGLDLFARLLVIGGGVTMAVAVAGRKFLTNG